LKKLSGLRSSFIATLLFLLLGIPQVLPAQTPDSRNEKQPPAAATAKAEEGVGQKAVTSAVKPTAASAKEQASGIQPPNSYRVGIDDELMISVWHEPELSQDVVVRPDGMVTLPLLNDIKVLGLTTEELQSLLTEKLKSIVNEPQVTIVVKAIRSLKVFLVGAVGKQGVYPLNGSMTALELIAEGGGLGPFAKSRSIYILRTVNAKQVRISFNYKKALTGKGDDPVLEPGDMVVVP
jgi:polysaccharide biosynthesis/export protein